MCCARLGGVAAVLFFVASVAAAAPRVTHKQVLDIKVAGKQGGTLQSIARTTDGKLVALIWQDRHGGVRGGGSNFKAVEIVVYDDKGSELKRWTVDFLGQAVGAGPDGSILVGGSGKIARFDAGGKLVRKADLPHIAELLGDKDKLRKKAEAQIASQKESIKQTKDAYAAQIKTFKSQIEKLKGDKENSELTAADKRKLARLEQQLKVYESINFEEDFGPTNVDTVVEQLLQRAATISGVSANDKDVFVVCGEQEGYGFAVWRTDHKFENPTKVLSQLGGCCGQMDVQANGDELFVAENTKHRVGHYDRDGKTLNTFGKKSGLFSSDGFGGCCNPMNVCISQQGEVFTAESEGIVRRFSTDGKSLGLVGRVTLTGGCKNVAIAVSPKADKIFFCDLPGSRIIVLGPVANEAEAEALGKDADAKAKAQEAAIRAAVDDEDADTDK
ncbi:MAG: hypothetical protein HY290_12545 [Planctomycetia bacterium]|nr:hypothetical protein [Planctomycetia bacterium]